MNAAKDLTGELAALSRSLAGFKIGAVHGDGREKGKRRETGRQKKNEIQEEKDWEKTPQPPKLISGYGLFVTSTERKGRGENTPTPEINFGLRLVCYIYIENQLTILKCCMRMH